MSKAGGLPAPANDTSRRSTLTNPQTPAANDSPPLTIRFNSLPIFTANAGGDASSRWYRSQSELRCIV